MPAKKKILLVEDSADDAFLMEWHLRQSGVAAEIETVHRPEQAIERLGHCEARAAKSNLSRPHIIIVALTLYAGHGFDLLQWIRRQPNLESSLVVAVGSSDQAEEVQRAYDLGANAYYIKAIDFKHFPEVVKSLQFLPTTEHGQEIENDTTNAR